MFLVEDTIESAMLQKLASGSTSTPDLLTFCIGSGFSQAGAYKTLKHLKEKEVIHIKKRMISLHPHWIEKLKEYILSVETTYLTKHHPFSLKSLSAGESFSFKHKKVNELNSTWDYYFATAISMTQSKSGPYYVYQPHDWMTLIRPENEIINNKIGETLAKPRIEGVGIKTNLGVQIKKSFYHRKFELISYDFIPRIHPNESYYVNIFGNILIEIYLDKESTQMITRFFTNPNAMLKDGQNLKQQLFAHQGKFRLKISHNEKKAARLKKKIGKYFYIPNQD